MGVLAIDPKRILDIGSGFGKYGIIVREAILSNRADKGDLEPVDDLVIDCVECARYFQNLNCHKSIYDHHFHCDIRDLPKVGYYDLALMIDIVEHLDRREIEPLIKRLKTTIKHIIVSVPRKVKIYSEQYYGADCPVHKHQPTIDDFKKNNPNLIDLSTERSLIFII